MKSNNEIEKYKRRLEKRKQKPVNMHGIVKRALYQSMLTLSEMAVNEAEKLSLVIQERKQSA